MASPGQQHPVAPPRVPRRTKLLGVVESEEKKALIKTFEGFNASTVSQYHIDAAKKCIENGGSSMERYVYIAFDDILKRNQVCNV